MQRKHLAKYLAYLLCELHLSDWAITISPEPCEPGNWATIDVTEGQRHATLKLDPELLNQPPEDIRWVLTHEVMHIHGNPLWEALLPLKPLLGHAAFTLLEKGFRLAEERANDAIARAFAPHLDLPPTKGKK